TEIVNSVTQVGEIASQIAHASAEQTAGIDQVNQAVAQMDDITQQNAALAEQAAAGSIAMSEQSTDMTKLLSFFRVNSATAKPAAHSKAAVTPTRAAAKKTVVPVLSSAKPKIDSSNEWEEF
ncbi:MAG: methyl-accepting chemotaxis protein, partial [Methylomonas sp.]